MLVVYLNDLQKYKKIENKAGKLKIFKMNHRILAVLVMVMMVPIVSQGQVKTGVDTLECHIIGFSVGV